MGLTYFITFRTYGSWLPGDPRGTVDRYHNEPRTPPAPGRPGRLQAVAALMRHSAVALGTVQREAVTRAVHDVCRQRGWELHALNVRTNHVHVVVSSPHPPETVMRALKAAATAHLRREGLMAPGTPVWALHGSTRYVKRGGLEAACTYVLEFQDGGA